MGHQTDPLRRAFAAARDPAERVSAGAELAVKLIDEGRANAAREVLGQAEEAAGALTGDREVARALHALGSVRLRFDDFPGALEDLVQANRRAENTDDLRLRAAVQAQLGKVLARLGDPKAAIERLTRALALAEQVGGYHEVESEAYINLSRVYARLDDPQRAGNYARRALAIARQRDSPRGMLMAFRMLGNVFAAETERLSILAMPNSEEGEQAIAWYNQALPLARQLGDRVEEVWLANNTAHVLRLTGREKDAVTLVEDVLGHGTEGLTPLQTALLYFNLGAALLRLGEPEAALEPMVESLKLVEANKAIEHLPKLHLGLAEAHERLGDSVAAVGHHKAYHEAERRLRGEDVRSKALLAAVRLEKEELAQTSLRLREESDALHRLLNSLKDRNEFLDDQVRRDPLTGLANRLAFDEWLEYLPGACTGPVSVALLDLDRFKQVNDEHSHLVGDEVLRRVAGLLRSTVRNGDLVARYGGEEFAVVLPATSVAEAALVCERIRRRVAAADWSQVAPALAVTVSIGVAQEDTMPGSITVADTRLYAAKDGGRNRVVAE